MAFTAQRETTFGLPLPPFAGNLRRALRGDGPVSRSCPPSKATPEPSFVKKISVRFRAAEGDFTIPGPKFLRAGKRIEASAEKPTKRHDGERLNGAGAERSQLCDSRPDSRPSICSLSARFVRPEKRRA